MDCTTKHSGTNAISEPIRASAGSAPTQQELHGQLLAAQADLQRELEVVGAIQRSLLPETLPEIPGLDMASYYQPCATAGGDYYDIVPLVEGRWGLVVADVAGHGASAAVIMAVMRALVHAHLPHTQEMPSYGFLGFINKQMTDIYTRDGRFVTVWCAMWDPAKRQLTYSSAGHNPARLVRGGAVVELNGAHGLPLGVDGREEYDGVTVDMEAGDLLVIYTDGITEARRGHSRERDFFETKRLDRVLLESGGASARTCVERVAAAVNTFAGTNVHADDQTMLVVRVN